MAVSKKQLAELELQLGNVFKLSKGNAPEVYGILRKVIPALKSGEYSMSASVTLGWCDKDGVIVGSGFGGINMTATKFIKHYLNNN